MHENIENSIALFCEKIVVLCRMVANVPWDRKKGKTRDPGKASENKKTHQDLSFLSTGLEFIFMATIIFRF